MNKPAIEAQKNKGKIVGYWAMFGDIREFGTTKAEALDKCEQAIIGQCELSAVCRVLSFGRYTVVVSRYRQGLYEYQILDSKQTYKYGQFWSSCQFPAPDMAEAISQACVSVAQRAIDDQPDTQLLAAILSYTSPKDEKEFHHWREMRQKFEVAI